MVIASPTFQHTHLAEESGSTEVNAVSTRKERSPKFAVGSEVRVKKGVTVPNRPDMPMGGWCGKIYQVNGTIYMVHWSEATLETLRSIHRERRQRDGADSQFMWLQEEVLETDSEKPQQESN
jgi:hypothetical protein